jgi:hypothetical protein
LNLPGPGRDQGQVPRCGTDPDEKRSAGQYRSHPLRSVPPRMGTIMIRFVGLLAVAVVVLALIWSR